MADHTQKDHELGLKVVCQYLEKDGSTVLSVTPDPEQFPSIIAQVEGRGTFIIVRTVRCADEAAMDDGDRQRLVDHAEKSEARAAFAPVGLWPTSERNEAGEGGFYRKYEGIEVFT